MIGVLPSSGSRNFEVFGKTGTGTFSGALGQKRRANAFARPAAAFVMNDVDGEMHLVGMRLQARGDRIETRLQFRQQVDEFLRRPFDRRMLDQKIDHLHAPEIGVEILFPLRFEQFVE